MIKIASFIRESISSLGVVNGLLFAFASLLDRASRGRCRIYKYYFVAQPVPTHRSEGDGRPSKTRLYRASAQDGIIQQFPRPSQEIARRFADGAVCFVAERANQLVGFIWIKQNCYREDEVKCLYTLRPANQVAWDFDVYVEPKFRMSRAFTQLWEAANEYLRERLCLWTVSRISAFNVTSLASHKRLGIVHLHTGLFLVLGPLQIAALSCAPYFHIAIGLSNGPEIVFLAPVEASKR